MSNKSRLEAGTSSYIFQILLTGNHYNLTILPSNQTLLVFSTNFQLLYTKGFIHLTER